MRAALVNELPWKEEHDSLQMKKEIDALGWLPGNYTVVKPLTEVIKAEGGVLSPGDARFTEQWEKYKILKKGDKISISKEIRGDPDAEVPADSDYLSLSRYLSFFQPAREARRLAQRAERPRRGLSALWASRRASAQAVILKWQLRATSPMNTSSSAGENGFSAKNES